MMGKIIQCPLTILINYLTLSIRQHRHSAAIIGDNLTNHTQAYHRWFAGASTANAIGDRVWVRLINPVLSFFPSFSLPDVLCDPNDLIRRKGTPFEAMTVRRTLSSDGLLSCKANVRRSVHSPQDHFIITLIISDRCDTRHSGQVTFA